MYKQVLEGVPFLNMDIDAVKVVSLEKLNKYGYVLVFDEFGRRKITKTEICLYHVLKHEKLANILILCTQQELYNWYRILITDIGVDFKIIPSHKDALFFISDKISNLLIMTPKTYEELNKQKGFCINDEEIVWDLVVIDEEIETEKINYNLYSDIGIKAKKLVFISAAPVLQDFSEINSMIRAILIAQDVYEISDEDFYANIITFGNASPAMRYYDTAVYQGYEKRNTRIIEYTMDDKAVLASRRILDLNTGLPLYLYGGNVFEEYDLDERKIYYKSSYSTEDLNILKGSDKKLEAFLSYIEQIKNDDSSRAIVYCTEIVTVNYIKKALDVVFYNDVNSVSIEKGSVYSTKDVGRKFLYNNKATYPKIIISTDGLGAVGERLDKITHIINYELPLNPSVLEQRMLRHGASNEKEFVVFCDTNGLFDSRILKKCLSSRLPKSLLPFIPSRNIMFDFAQFSEMIAEAVTDLYYINSFALEVDNCYDLIKRFRADYGILPDVVINKSADLARITSRMIKDILNMFFLDFDGVKHLNKNEIISLIDSKLDEFKGGLIYPDKRGNLCCIKGDELRSCLFNDNYKRVASELSESNDFGNETSVKQLLIEHFSNGIFSDEITVLINEMGYNICFSVLYGLWKYLVSQNMVNYGFDIFIMNFNKGGA